MRPKSSVDPLLVIEANLVLVILGLFNIYTLLRFHRNKSSVIIKM